MQGIVGGRLVAGQVPVLELRAVHMPSSRVYASDEVVDNNGHVRNAIPVDGVLAAIANGGSVVVLEGPVVRIVQGLHRLPLAEVGVGDDTANAGRRNTWPCWRKTRLFRRTTSPFRHKQHAASLSKAKCKALGA